MRARGPSPGTPALWEGAFTFWFNGCSDFVAADQDECENEISCVNGECLNTDGSYHCFCSHPLVLDITGNRCVNLSSVAGEYKYQAGLVQCATVGGMEGSGQCCLHLWPYSLPLGEERIAHEVQRPTGAHREPARECKDAWRPGSVPDSREMLPAEFNAGHRGHCM